MAVDAPETWHRGADEDKPSYLSEMLFSQANVNVGLAACALAGVAAIPMGLAGAAIPLVLFGAGEAIASMFVPSSQSFRNRVDRKHRARRRVAFAEHLSAQINRLAPAGEANWRTYYKMGERIAALQDLRGHRQDVISERDLERLDDAAVDYLSLWLTQLTIQDRLDSLGAHGLEKQLRTVDERLKRNPDDLTSRKAKAELEELVRRAQRLAARKSVVDASILALPDAIEEIYTSAISSSTAGDVAQRLQEAVDRLQIEEELDQKLDAELGDLPMRSAAARQAGGVRR